MHTVTIACCRIKFANAAFLCMGAAMYRKAALEKSSIAQQKCFGLEVMGAGEITGA